MSHTGSESDAKVQEHFINAGGFLTRCLLAGPSDGKPVLLLHDAAFGGSSDVTWRQVLPALAKKYRIIAPDLLGFGGSDKVVFVDRSPYEFRNQHVLALLDVLGIKRPVHLIGSSFGGSMGLHMLREHASRLASVVSIAGAGGGWRTVFGREILGSWNGTREGLKAIAEVLASDSGTFSLDAHVDERFKSACTNGHYRAVTAAAIKLPPSLASSGDRDPFPRVPDSKIPVLLIAGQHDTLVEADWTEKLLPLLPSRSEALVMASKHSPNLDHAPALNEALLAWLTRHTD
ncbi:alpha/beta fold hydrolase [Rhizobium lusitanum]|uniref:alpha/beta fold hydrolase n=1 Tax=Rhizobium lusitanum TaxID=293958 RepID=UPI0015728AD8|nr:alpha/beta fold hydrolase [Rhizobium lusitanum]NTJ11780.1 alpha/beta fold hydrolase [Rhizobium lusitanum]